MPEAHTITRICPAKINLALSVGAPLPTEAAGGGMHPIASWMVAIDFHDDMTITRRDGQFSLFSIEFEKLDSADHLSPAGHCDVDWPLNQDLAFRAHEIMQKHSGRELPIIARIAKNIPSGAGLGGGSSNAAGMFIAINQLFDLGCSTQTLIDLSKPLGSDIAFLIAAQAGRPSAIVSHLGDRIEPSDMPGPIHLVLIFPPFGCPTGPVYQAFDENLDDDGRVPDLSAVQSLAGRSSLTADGPFNDLAQPACRVQPQLGELVERLAAITGQPIHVSGSGSTLFTIAADASAAQTLAHKIVAETELPAIATQTLT